MKNYHSEQADVKLSLSRHLQDLRHLHHLSCRLVQILSQEEVEP